MRGAGVSRRRGKCARRSSDPRGTSASGERWGGASKRARARARESGWSVARSSRSRASGSLAATPASHTIALHA
eukprot:880264-Rhodomonas_salina.1